MKTLAAIVSAVVLLQQPDIRVDVQLQQLVATVRDSSGNIVRHLRAEDFRIEENGVPQPIAFFSEGADERVSLGILIDTSGSMAARNGGLSRLSAAEGVARVLMRLMKPHDEFMLMSFNDAMDVNHKFTEDPLSVESAMTKLKTAGGTNLYGAVSGAIRKMKEAKNRKRALIVITDGLAGGDLETLAREIRNSEVTVYTFGLASPSPNIGFVAPLRGLNTNITLVTGVAPETILKAIAEASGGRSELFDVSDLDNAIQRMVEFDRVIATDLRGQYTLAYYPRNTSAAIRVRSNDPNYTISSRRLAMALPPAGK